MRLPAAPSSTPPRDLLRGAALGSLTSAFCAISKPPLWDGCRALGFDCFGDGLEAGQLIDSAALMGARFQAKRLASDLDLILSSGSFLVRPAISGPGHFQSYKRSGNRYADVRFQSTAAVGPGLLELEHPSLRSLTFLLPRSTSGVRGTPTVQSAELALPNRSGYPIGKDRRLETVVRR